MSWILLFRRYLMYSLLSLLTATGCKVSTLSINDNKNKALFGLVDSIESLDLHTGDLMLFQSLTRDGIFTQIGTLSPYTHCALVIKNPDGSHWLLHATDNNFAGERIPVLFEDLPRNGVILTRLEDSFISADYGNTGFYKHIRILRFDEGWSQRPDRETLLRLYEINKNRPFTQSKIPFILSAFDLSFFGHDLISMPEDESVFCSGFVHHILKEAGIPVTNDQKGNEYTPKDIEQLEPYQTAKPMIFKFINRKYRIKQLSIK